MSDDRIQEIFTRAIAGRAKRRLAWVHTLDAENVKHVLGVHLGTTTVSVREENGQPIVEVSVHCDLWCREEQETTVRQTMATSTFEVDVTTTGQVVGDREIQVSLVDSPCSTGIKVADGQVIISLEVSVTVEVTASVRIWVRTVDLSGGSQNSSTQSEGDNLDTRDEEQQKDRSRLKTR